MYKAYFGFTCYPFGKDVSTDELLHHKRFKEYGKRMEFLKRHGGIAVVWGPAGCGKTTALRWLRNSLNANRYQCYYLPEPPNSVTDFYRQLAFAMELQPAFRRAELFRQIQERITDLVTEKKVTPFIILDEMQMYTHSVLEAVRLFLNFDMDSRNYVTLIMAGSPEFTKRLRYAVYEHLAQRITVQFPFEGLSPEDVENYLQHRLSVAGVKHRLFEPDAVQFIYQVTKGIMRKIDVLAVQSLLLAAGLKKKSVDQAIVDTAVHENFWA